MLRYLDIDGHRLAALALDEDLPGEPTVLIHGISHSVMIWAPDRAFRGAGPVYCLSLPDHFPAASPPGRRPLAAEPYADLLVAGVRHLTGGRPATLCGVSTGGFAALAVAARAPALARRVISISGFARGRWTGSYGLLQRLARGGPLGRAVFRASILVLSRHPELTKIAWRTVTPTMRLRALAAYPHFQEVVAAMIPGAFRLDPDAMQAAFAAFPAIDITAWLPDIAAPTLAVIGDRDPIVPPAQGRLIAARVPRAELLVFPGAGHMPHFEQPARFRRSLADFLARTA